jgi:hypothetical protein
MDQLSPDQRAELARDDQGPVTKSIVISFTVISFISVCVRLSTRFSYQNVGSEDYTIAISTVSLPLTQKEQEANSLTRLLRLEWPLVKFFVWYSDSTLFIQFTDNMQK